MSTNNQPATARIQAKKQTLEDAYSPPANFLEIDITDPQTHGLPKSKGRYTDYAVKMKVSGEKKNHFVIVYYPEAVYESWIIVDQSVS